MAQQIISFINLRIGVHLIGLDRWWWQMPCLHQRFTIKDPLEIETRYLPLTPLRVIHIPKGVKTIRDVRRAMRNNLAAESVLKQVSA